MSSKSRGLLERECKSLSSARLKFLKTDVTKYSDLVALLIWF